LSAPLFRTWESQEVRSGDDGEIYCAEVAGDVHVIRFTGGCGRPGPLFMFAAVVLVLGLRICYVQALGIFFLFYFL